MFYPINLFIKIKIQVYTSLSVIFSDKKQVQGHQNNVLSFIGFKVTRIQCCLLLGSRSLEYSVAFCLFVCFTILQPKNDTRMITIIKCCLLLGTRSLEYSVAFYWVQSHQNTVQHFIGFKITRIQCCLLMGSRSVEYSVAFYWVQGHQNTVLPFNGFKVTRIQLHFIGFKVTRIQCCLLFGSRSLEYSVAFYLSVCFTILQPKNDIKKHIRNVCVIFEGRIQFYYYITFLCRLKSSFTLKPMEKILKKQITFEINKYLVIVLCCIYYVEFPHFLYGVVLTYRPYGIIFVLHKHFSVTDFVTIIHVRDVSK